MDLEKLLIALADFCMCNGGLWTETKELEEHDRAYCRGIGLKKDALGSEAYHALDSEYNTVLVLARQEGYLNGFEQGFEGALRLLTGLLDKAEV